MVTLQWNFSITSNSKTYFSLLDEILTALLSTHSLWSVIAHILFMFLKEKKLNDQLSMQTKLEILMLSTNVI